MYKYMISIKWDMNARWKRLSYLIAIPKTIPMCKQSIYLFNAKYQYLKPFNGEQIELLMLDSSTWDY